MTIRPCAQTEDRHVFKSVVVIVIDDHNGLCEHKTSKYLGLSSNPTVVVDYGRFFTELAHFTRVVSCFADCAQLWKPIPAHKR